jgi:hypothetical protein
MLPRGRQRENIASDDDLGGMLLRRRRHPLAA